MNIIMNKNMKKRMDSAIDLYWFVNGNGGAGTEFRFRSARVGGSPTVKMTAANHFGDVYTATQSRPDWPTLKNKIYINHEVYRHKMAATFQRKFSKVKITLSSSGIEVFRDTIDMVEGNTPIDRYKTDYKNDRYYIRTNSSGDVASGIGTTYELNMTSNVAYQAGINYPNLMKSSLINGIPYSQAKVTGTVDGNVRVSLIAPFDILPTQTGVVLDSFQIEFFDDFDRPTAIVTGTIGDLNSTADVKMANTLIEDGAYINISGMDDFLITTPNTIAISN